MAAITIDSVTKEYANGFVAVHGVDLDIDDGEFLVLVGPSGCGKSTLLRMVAGLEEITDGEVSIGGRVVNDEDPKDRDVAMVFQNYALYPHMTVRKNISYALRLAKVPKAEIEKRVAEAARVLELEPVLDNKPGQLSGGQRQRVAMGRAIVRQPAAYLMDEPLSNLDAKLRVQMRAEIARLQHELGVTTIYVTHDQIEAMTMGTRVAVLKGGFIQQVDSPQALYDHPINLFVAAFIGSPSMNLYRARLGGDANGASVRIGGSALTVPPASFDDHAELGDYLDREVVVGIRPEALYDPALRVDVADHETLEATVELVEALGADLLVHTSIEATAAEVDDPDLEGAAPLPADLDHPDRVPCLARFSPRSRVQLAETVQLGVDTSQLHFFDPETGTRIQGRR